MVPHPRFSRSEGLSLRVSRKADAPFAWSYRQTKSEASMDKQHKASIDGDQWAQCVRDHGWLWDAASAPASATLILAHGAGAPMDSAWMNDMAARLVAQGV